MIDGKAFFLNGTCSFSDLDDKKLKLTQERNRREGEGLMVRFIKRTSTEYAIYTYPKD